MTTPKKSPNADGGIRARASNLDRTRSVCTDHFITRQSDGETYGKLPSEVSTGAMQAVGHQPGPLLEIIRAKCLDCCCYQVGEIRKCTAVQCVLWPYRMGSNPFRRGKGNSGSFKPKTNGKKPGISGETLYPAGSAP